MIGTELARFTSLSFKRLKPKLCSRNCPKCLPRLHIMINAFSERRIRDSFLHKPYLNPHSNSSPGKARNHTKRAENPRTFLPRIPLVRTNLRHFPKKAFSHEYSDPYHPITTSHKRWKVLKFSVLWGVSFCLRGRVTRYLCFQDARRPEVKACCFNYQCCIMLTRVGAKVLIVFFFLFFFFYAIIARDLCSFLSVCFIAFEYNSPHLGNDC